MLKYNPLSLSVGGAYNLFLTNGIGQRKWTITPMIMFILNGKSEKNLQM